MERLRYKFARQLEWGISYYSPNARWGIALHKKIHSREAFWTTIVYKIGGHHLMSGSAKSAHNAAGATGRFPDR